LSREQLRDGYVRLMNALYDPGAYFTRLEALYLDERIPWGQGPAPYWRRHRWNWLRTQARNLIGAAALFGRLMWGIPETLLRREYRRRLWRLVKTRPDANLALLYVIKCALHYHHHTMAREIAHGHSPVYNSF
jgi:hypothetical protein